MIKWIYENRYLENQELLFYIAVTVLILIIVVTFILAKKELKHHDNK